MSAPEWQKCLFQVMVSHNGMPIPRTTGGWVKEPFALDPRYYSDALDPLLQKGWVITHLPTGFVVRGIKGDLGVAKTVADKMLAADPWDFVDASAARSRLQIIKDLMVEHDEISNTSDFYQGLWLEDVE